MCLNQSRELPLTGNFVELLQKIDLASKDQVLDLLKFQADLRRCEVLDQDLRCFAVDAELSGSEIVSDSTFEFLKYDGVANCEQQLLRRLDLFWIFPLNLWVGLGLDASPINRRDSAKQGAQLLAKDQQEHYAEGEREVRDLALFSRTSGI